MSLLKFIMAEKKTENIISRDIKTEINNKYEVESVVAALLDI